MSEVCRMLQLLSPRLLPSCTPGPHRGTASPRPCRLSRRRFFHSLGCGC